MLCRIELDRVVAGLESLRISLQAHECFCPRSMELGIVRKEGYRPLVEGQRLCMLTLHHIQDPQLGVGVQVGRVQTQTLLKGTRGLFLPSQGEERVALRVILLRRLTPLSGERFIGSSD